MITYHLSHTDLDGYGCQFITSKIFENIRYFNSNYGEEIHFRLREILNKIKEESHKNETLFLITDLNLTLDDATLLDSEIKKLNHNGFNIKLQLLDHHITGAECRDKFGWYLLDESKSATKITFEFFKLDESFKEIVDVINAVDIWIENSKYFEFGKVLQRAVSHDSKEISTFMFPNEAREYKLFIINRAKDIIKDGYIAFDEQLYFIKKEFLKIDKNETLDNLTSNKIVSLLENKKENLTIFYKNKRCLLTYMIGSISIIASEFLKRNSEFDFVMDLNFKGTVGFRANNRVDVSQIAKELADGGGHPNASGGRFRNFKEFFSYEDIKIFMIEHIKKVE